MDAQANDGFLCQMCEQTTMIESQQVMDVNELIAHFKTHHEVLPFSINYCVSKAIYVNRLHPRQLNTRTSNQQVMGSHSEIFESMTSLVPESFYAVKKGPTTNVLQVPTLLSHRFNTDSSGLVSVRQQNTKQWDMFALSQEEFSRSNHNPAKTKHEIRRDSSSTYGNSGSIMVSTNMAQDSIVTARPPTLHHSTRPQTIENANSSTYSDFISFDNQYNDIYDNHFLLAEEHAGNNPLDSAHETPNLSSTANHDSPDETIVSSLTANPSLKRKRSLDPMPEDLTTSWYSMVSSLTAEPGLFNEASLGGNTSLESFVEDLDKPEAGTHEGS